MSAHTAVIVVLALLVIAFIPWVIVWGIQARNCDIRAPHIGRERLENKKVQHVTGDEAHKVLQAKQPAIVLVTAPVNLHSRRMELVLDVLIDRYPHIHMAIVPHHDCQTMCDQLGIQTYPTLLTNFGNRKYTGFKTVDELDVIIMQHVK
ncbi:MAG: hypothetical protein K0U52_07400 [Gammaproteobacteria bacterium]|nr:hypothetical protein [Gammaproteobacteria bacterium]